MRSVSGIRGIVGDTLTPEIAARYAAAFGTFIKGGRVVIGGDARPTGPIIKAAAIAGFRSVGCDVLDIGLCPTPTIPIIVDHVKARAGCAITASHNPIEWNALKILGGAKKPFPTKDVAKIFAIADAGKMTYVDWRKIGDFDFDYHLWEYHLERVLKLKLVNRRGIKRRKFKVVIDAVNGAGSYLGPELLRRLGCSVTKIHCTPDGRFPRRPEPVPTALRGLGQAVRTARADLGFALDPDADRLAIVDETGKPLGEEYTLAFTTKWVLQKKKGNVAINMSTSTMIDDLAAEAGCRCYHSKVGELNVAAEMKKRRAIIGGEGNGGVILPELSYGRDAAVGMALVLSLLAAERRPISDMAAGLPRYYPAKTARPMPKNFAIRLKRLEKRFLKGKISRLDGVKVFLPDGSVHVRASNTEPIFRVMAEAKTARQARALVADALAVFAK
jgi:phosphomannomutase